MTDRRRIGEWAALYELEPSLMDVFVEGPTDRAFVAAVLRHCGLGSVQVYEIDAVEVPVALLAENGLQEGNRSRVIAMAVGLERTCSIDLTRRVCCIADADHEAGQPPQIHTALLLYTDYTSMQLYCYTDSTLHRYFEQVVLGMPLSADKVLDILEPVLRQAALSRRAAMALAMNTAPVDLTDDCSFSGLKIDFGFERFATRFLNKAAAFHRRPDYLEKMRRIEASLPVSGLLWIHAEDFIDLLHWLIVRLRGADRTVPKHLLGKALLLAVPLGEAAEQPLFAELVRRLGGDLSRAA